jgi:hypothetical protein
MKSAWGPELCNIAAWNTTQVEEVGEEEANIFDFEQMLVDDVDCEEWDKSGLNSDGP